MRALAAAVLLAAGLAAGAAAAKPAPVVGNAKNGKKLFVAHSCGSCHMMAAAGAMDDSGVGADLDTTRKTYAQIVAQITNGGHGMAPYKKVLTTAQIQDLAAFVYKTSHHV